MGKQVPEPASIAIYFRPYSPAGAMMEAHAEPIMSTMESNLLDTGLEVIDLEGDAAFAGRGVMPRNPTMQMEAMRRLTRAFVENPDTILQELVDAAVDLCGADSAGISMEQQDKSDDQFYHWVATAGQYKSFLNATLPRYPSACGICLERGTPQLFRVSQPFFERMQVDAPIVTDGILLPWQVEEMRGTLWIMAHGRVNAFDMGDCRMIQTLADFAAMAVRHKRQQKTLLDQAGAAAAAAMAHELAHQINNPLQALTNIMFLAAEGHCGTDTRSLGQSASRDLERLSTLVRKLLAIPADSSLEPLTES